MNLILLGGNSPKNEAWIERIENALADVFDDTRIQSYTHWQEGGSMQVNVEREALRELAEDIGEPYAVFAKSAGVILALDAIRENDIAPKTCVFVGSPIGASAAERFANYRTPTLFIQQTNDPIRPFEKVKNVLENSEAKNYTLKEVPGDDHMYDDVETIAQLVSRFIDED